MRNAGKSSAGDMAVRLAALEHTETEPLRAEWLRLYRALTTTKAQP